MTTLRNWLDDLPQQFKGKHNIEVLLGAFAKQMDELLKVYEDLKTETTLDNAKGQNLRYIGDIFSLSTKEAHAILRTASTLDITDDTYKKILQYKALQNNCDCTYYDIMDSINLLWNTDKIKYVESPERPATIYIELPEVNVDGLDPSIGRILAIKPSGVAVIYANGYAVGVNISGIEKANVESLIMSTPIVEAEETMKSSIVLSAQVENMESFGFSIIMQKNCWTLNGDVLLDGSRVLSAEKVEEVL